MDQKSTHPEVDLFVFAGESSGDRIGAELLKALFALNPHLSITAVAGPAMREHPIDLLMEMESFQVMGFVDVIKSLPTLIKLFNKIKKHLLKNPPKAVVLIDYPGFNLKLAKHLKKAGFAGPIIHYVCPSVWAWKKGRIHSMSRDLSLLLSIFPFEKECFTRTSLPVEYIGHPLAETVHCYTPKTLPLSLKSPIFSIFPGSRKVVIERNLPLQLQAAVDLTPSHYTLVISCAHPDLLPVIQKEVASYPHHTIHILSAEHNDDLMHHSTLAFATSGTITLELALHKVPTLVTYAITRLDYILAKHVFRIRLPHYCIANYTAGMRIFPEFFGPYFNKDKIYKTLSFMLNTPEELTLCREKCSLVKNLLYKSHSSQLAASHILTKMGN